jgi:DNA-binding MarR family transcriptional regulator
MAHKILSSANDLVSSPPRALPDRLHSAAIHLLRRVRAVDERLGLGPARLSALSVVVFGGPLPLGDLAAAEQVSAPTMSRLAAALEREGLVRRQPDARDGRVVRIAATARGARLMQEGRRRRVAELTRLLDGLPPRRRAVLEEAVGILEEALSAGRGSPRPS